MLSPSHHQCGCPRISPGDDYLLRLPTIRARGQAGPNELRHRRHCHCPHLVRGSMVQSRTDPIQGTMGAQQELQAARLHEGC